VYELQYTQDFGFDAKFCANDPDYVAVSEVGTVAGALSQDQMQYCTTRAIDLFNALFLFRTPLSTGRHLLDWPRGR
jgi:hypothetical protein